MLRRWLGFTLIELLVTLSIFALILFFSTPLTSAWYNKNQLQTVAVTLQNAIHLARAEALSLGAPLVLAQMPGAKDWSEGMLLWVDNGTHRYSDGVKRLHEWHWSYSGIEVQWHGFQSQEFLLLAGDLGHSTSNGYFMIANHREPPIKLVVNRLGKARQVML